jgi:hypothetical protein
MLVNFAVVSSISLPFDIFYGHFGKFCGHFGTLFPFWYVVKNKNLATLA